VIFFSHKDTKARKLTTYEELGVKKKTPLEPGSFLFEGILSCAAGITFIRLLPAVGGVANSLVLLFI
jgi:hypothetical protein